MPNPELVFALSLKASDTKRLKHFKQLLETQMKIRQSIKKLGIWQHTSGHQAISPLQFFLIKQVFS